MFPPLLNRKQRRTIKLKQKGEFPFPSISKQKREKMKPQTTSRKENVSLTFLPLVKNMTTPLPYHIRSSIMFFFLIKQPKVNQISQANSFNIQFVKEINFLEKRTFVISISKLMRIFSVIFLCFQIGWKGSPRTFLWKCSRPKREHFAFYVVFCVDNMVVLK